MPFTPFHFGPHACVSLPFYRYLDIPIFMGANVALDIEPLIVMHFNLDYPFHGYCHTLLFGGLIGLLLATVAFPFRHFIKKIMNSLRLAYTPTYAKMGLAGVLGAWLHVLFDAPLYNEMMPFYPLQDNFLFAVVSHRGVYRLCAACFAPALLLYLYIAFISKRRKAKEG